MFSVEGPFKDKAIHKTIKVRGPSESKTINIVLVIPSYLAPTSSPIALVQSIALVNDNARHHPHGSFTHTKIWYKLLLEWSSRRLAVKMVKLFLMEWLIRCLRQWRKKNSRKSTNRPWGFWICSGLLLCYLFFLSFFLSFFLFCYLFILFSSESVEDFLLNAYFFRIPYLYIG